MIEETFLHIKGIGPGTEKRLREAGIFTWKDALSSQKELPMKGKKRDSFLREIDESLKALSSEDISFFTARLPGKEQWRVLSRWIDCAAFFDIETSGLNYFDSEVTVICAHTDDKTHTFIKGQNLDDFLDLAGGAPLLVSFNGSSFDIPFLERNFSVPALGPAHVDLRWVTYHEGYRGGLKEIERSLGIERPGNIRDVDGFEAVYLYHRWLGGDAAALQRLCAYCRADTVSLKLLAGRVLRKKGLEVLPVNEKALFSEAVNFTLKDNAAPNEGPSMKRTAARWRRKNIGEKNIIY